jgi:hypothetical protein
VHTLKLDVVEAIWTYLFTQRVEFLFFICLAIFKQLQPMLLTQDLNQTLEMINSIKSLIDGPLLARDSLFYLQQTPLSFIANDLIAPTDDL